MPALQLVNTQQESLEANERVQECLAKVKQVRKQIVRYVQVNRPNISCHSINLQSY